MPYLEAFQRGGPVLGGLAHLLQLLDSLTEVSHPLDDGQTRGHRVAAPRLGDHTCQEKVAFSYKNLIQTV